MSKADLIIHPARLRIIQEFASAEHLTAQQLSDRLADVPRATLYRHLAALLDGGILTVAETRPVRAVEERIYALPEGAANVGPRDYQVTDPSEHMRYFTTFLGLVRGDFQRYLEERPPADLPSDGVAYYQVPLNLNASEYRRFVGAITAAIKPLLQLPPSPKRTRRLFTFITMPGISRAP
jgi:DNA-binding transcriptional ArsR family regulator